MLSRIKAPLAVFLEERDWLRFNSRKSLSKTLFIECGELSDDLHAGSIEGQKEEAGDVYSALLQLDMLREKETGESFDDRRLAEMFEEAKKGDALALTDALLIQSSKMVDPDIGEGDYYGLFLRCMDLYASYMKTMGFDPLACLNDKLKKTAAHYPVEKCKGKATKYTEL